MAYPTQLVSVTKAKVAGDAPSGLAGSFSSYSQLTTTGNVDPTAGVSQSADGRYVAFVSAATNFGTTTSAQNGSTRDIFLKDMTTGELICVYAGNVNNHASHPIVSDDGRYVTLQAGTSIYRVDVHDVANPQLIATGAANPHMSANGQYVVYTKSGQIYLRDMGGSGTEVLISRDNDGHTGNAASDNAFVSNSGLVVFESKAGNFVDAGGHSLNANPYDEIFLKDPASGELTHISVKADGTGGIGSATIYPASKGAMISGNGRYVVFESSNNDFVAISNATGTSAINSAIYRKDLVTGQVDLVSVGKTGKAAVNATNASISADGRLVLFQTIYGATQDGSLTTATSTLSPDYYSYWYIKDMVTGEVYNIDLPSAALKMIGAPASIPAVYLNPFISFSATISADGKYITLSSPQTLDAGKVPTSTDTSNTNDDGQYDVFRISLPAAITNPKGLPVQGEALIGTGGDDVLEGGKLDDILIGKAGNDTLKGNAGNDTLQGGEGDDLLDGGAGADRMEGGADDDTYIVDNAGDQVIEQADEGIDTVHSSINYTLTANVENLTLTGKAALNGTGNALANLLTGNDGNNILDGGLNTDGFDTLVGGKGNDTYIVRNSGDVVTENTNEGTDTVKAHISYGLTDHVENLILEGIGHIDGTGNALNNTLTGNAGDNVLDGGDGVDKLIGGAGNDTYIIDLIAKGSGTKATVVLQDTITEAAGANGGNDTLQLRSTLLDGFTGTAKVILGANLENLDASGTGTLAIDLTGNALDNTLIGNAGDNILDGGAGIDTLVGGDGDDTYVLDREEELALVEELEGEGNDTLRITYKNTSKTEALVVDLSQLNLQHVENIQLTGTGLFELIGNAADNILDGGKNAAVLKGGAGDDTYRVGHKDAQIHESADEGIDTVESIVTWTLGDNLENLTLLGKAAINGAGNALANQLIGSDGNNILDGGLNTSGFDTLVGGKGNDTYIVRNSGDVVIENANEGTDTVKAHISYDLTDHVENLILEGTGHIDGTGNGLKNTLTGNAGNNILDGQGGVDKLIGGKGGDIYIVDLVVKGTGTKATAVLEDTITEAKDAGIDTLQLEVRNDDSPGVDFSGIASITLGANLENLDARNTGELTLNLTGNALDNEIWGNAGDNTLNGGAGNDILHAGTGGDNILIGGAGADILYGGDGNDTFRFTSLKDLGLGDGKQDVIHDFTSGQDKLDFKALKGWSLVDAPTPGTPAANLPAAKQLWWTVQGGDVIVYGNSDKDWLTNEFSIKLVGITALSADDFIFT